MNDEQYDPPNESQPGKRAVFFRYAVDVDSRGAQGLGGHLRGRRDRLRGSHGSEPSLSPTNVNVGLNTTTRGATLLSLHDVEIVNVRLV